MSPTSTTTTTTSSATNTPVTNDSEWFLPTSVDDAISTAEDAYLMVYKRDFPTLLTDSVVSALSEALVPFSTAQILISPTMLAWLSAGAMAGLVGKDWLLAYMAIMRARKPPGRNDATKDHIADGNGHAWWKPPKIHVSRVAWKKTAVDAATDAAAVLAGQWAMTAALAPSGTAYFDARIATVYGAAVFAGLSLMSVMKQDWYGPPIVNVSY